MSGFLLECDPALKGQIIAEAIEELSTIRKTLKCSKKEQTRPDETVASSIKRSLHTLKASLSGLGYRKLTETVDSVESLWEQKELPNSTEGHYGPRFIRMFIESLQDIVKSLKRIEMEAKESWKPEESQNLPIFFESTPIWEEVRIQLQQTAHDLEKDIKLDIDLSVLVLDPCVLNTIKNPLLHILRNAADHGIENAAERTAAGKQLAGTITIKATHSENNVSIEIADDGRGLSCDKIRTKALQKKFATAAQLDAMDEPCLFKFIFREDFSTAANVTLISGRGIGLHAARTDIEKKGGTISVKSTKGQGTTFVINIPVQSLVPVAEAGKITHTKFFAQPA